ncbi:hypothetical protein LguiB_009734 [Lonicera macranthoides]
MAEEVQYSSTVESNKRKYEGQTTPPPPSGRRTTGFSAPIASQSPDSGGQAPPSYNSVAPPVDEIQLAKQRAQEIAARLFNNAEPKRPRVENGGGFDSNDGKGFSSGPTDYGQKPMYNAAPSMPTSYGYPGPSKKIEIPNGRVGVIIGKGGETIKYLQLQSGAKIQVTRDMDADPNSQTRAVELMGTSEQIAKAEQLITEVLAEAESGGSGVVSRRVTGQPGGAEQFVMKVPNNKVGLIIGKGGETIKNMQATTGARIQVIPLHLPPGDTSNERTVQIDGTSEQIEAAKQLVNEVISENRMRNPMGGGYQQQGYQARPPTNWAPPGQQPGYGYGQPGAYPGQPQYNNMTQQPYGSYPPQPTSGGYGTSWDPSSAAPTQQTTPAGGYDYYGQQQAPAQQQTPGSTVTPADTNAAYGYSQQAAAGYSQGQGYSQDGYGGYQASGAQSGYGQTQPGYDQQQGGYSSTPGYGNVTNQTPEGQTPYSDSNQTPQQAQSSQQGYTTSQQPSPNPSYPPQGTTQPGYGVPPASGYGAQPPSAYGPGYGAPPAQKPPTGQPGYGQPQQSPTAAQASYGQPGYAHSQQPPAQSGYAQPDSGAQRAPPSGYGTATAPGYGPGPTGYGAQPGYGAPQYNSAYAGGYAQPPPVYSGDGSAAAAPASQAAVPPSGVAKTSPQS